ncbi:MAG: AAA family ATPase [Clostridia bacterium]
MSNFAKYYLDFVFTFFENIGLFFKVQFGAIGKIFTVDIPSYFKRLGEVVPELDFLGWVMLIIVTLINLAFAFFLIYRIVQLIRRFIFYRAVNIDKDKLVEEIAHAKQQIAELTKEKNKLFELRMGMYPGDLNAVVTGDEKNGKIKGTKNPQLPVRFAKLTALDAQYNYAVDYIDMSDYKPSLAELTDRFINFAASQMKLYYSKHIIRSFFAGMAATKVIILEGISGTGKTSLPYAMGHFFNNPSTIVSVQPSWRDRADLVGYLNEFSKQFNETEFLAAIYNANYRDDPNFVILDEMNLARIEYYFAEFLSIMEMPDISEWEIELVARKEENDPQFVKEGKLLVPQNMWFIGTANQDDSTFTITDKVYDRTITIDLNQRGEYFDAPLTENVTLTAEYLDKLFTDSFITYKMSDINKANIDTIDDFITEKMKVTFGNRIKRQIERFVPTYVAAGGTENEAIDFVLMSKIFRKFTSLNLSFLSKELNDLISLMDKKFGKAQMKRSTEYIKYLIRTA